jgi:hypothetical protein
MTKTKSVLLLLFSFLFIHVARAQTRFTVSGSVKEKIRRMLIGCTVYLLEIPKSGTMSNGYGFYSISAPAGSYTMIASFAGYRQDTMRITLDKNISIVIELEQKTTELQEVVVSSKKKRKRNQTPGGCSEIICQ